MSDWNLPILGTNYPDFLTYLKDRDFDAASLFYNTTPTNPQEGFIRFLRASLVFQEYLSGVWTTRLLGIAGGGTGAANAADARTNLGLGSMALQNANSVAISGGTITGIGFAASVLTSGNLDPARLPLGGNWNLTSLLNILGHAVHTKAFGANYRVGAGTTLTDTDYLYECSGGTINLPDATTITGRIYIIKRSGTTVILDPFGAQTISINGSSVATYSGLGSNQSIILQSTGTAWIAVTMGGTVYRDNQYVEVTLGAGNSIETQALPVTVNEVKKALIIPLSGMSLRDPTFGGDAPVRSHFSDSGGNLVTAGSATHLKILYPFTAPENRIFNFMIEERE